MHKTNTLYYRRHHLKKGLEEFVKYAWVMKSRETISGPDLLIPDGYPEIIFVLKGAYRKEFLDPGKAPATITRSCAIGIQTQSVLASRMDHCHLVGLKLKPAGAYTLFGDRLRHISDTNAPLDELGVEWLCDLNRRLQHCQEEAAAIDLLSGTLLRQTGHLKSNRTTALASSFLDAILTAKGQISVQELARQHCLSVRHFQRKFKDLFGVSPKKFLNIIRFKQLYRSSILRQKPPADFLDYGYYDQMHFIKDFRKHLGVNPSKSHEPSFLRMNRMAQRNASKT